MCQIYHNQALKESNNHILSLPNSLQVAILRLVLRYDGEYIVSIKQPHLCVEPGVLKVSKDVRAIALPLFYREASFQCKADNFNVMALQPWVHKRQLAMQPKIDLTDGLHIGEELWAQRSKEWQSSPQGQMAAKMINKINAREDISLPAPTTPFWAIDDNPCWANLVDWLKLYHAKQIEGYEFRGRVEPEHVVLKSVFGIVRALHGQSWSVVLKVLTEARSALTAVDHGWDSNALQDAVAQSGGEDDSNVNDEEQGSEHYGELDVEVDVDMDGVGGHEEYDDDSTDSEAGLGY